MGGWVRREILMLHPSFRKKRNHLENGDGEDSFFHWDSLVKQTKAPWTGAVREILHVGLRQLVTSHRMKVDLLGQNGLDCFPPKPIYVTSYWAAQSAVTGSRLGTITRMLFEMTVISVLFPGTSPFFSRKKWLIML